jgi:hypothetical protein
MERAAYFLTACLLLTSCASTYKPPEEVAILKASLNKEGARQIVADVVKNKGFCTALTDYRPPVGRLPIRWAHEVTGSTFTYTIEVADVVPAYMEHVDLRPSHLEKISFSLAKIKRLQLANNGVDACRPEKNPYMVTAFSDQPGPNKFSGQTVHFVVSDISSRNALVAALLYYSPKAEMVEGFGF